MYHNLKSLKSLMNWQQKKLEQWHKVPYIYILVLLQIKGISVAENVDTSSMR